MSDTDAVREELERLDKVFTLLQPRKPGDVDIQQLSKRYNCTTKTVWAKMKPLLESGEYETLWVDDLEKGRVKIYRRKGRG
jgi:hypothetical protein